MATTAELQYLISVQDKDLKRLRGELRDLGKDAGDAADTTSAKFDAMGQKMQGVGRTASKYVTLPLLGAGAASLKLASDVDKGLREVNTLFGETGAAADKSFSDMQKGLADFSRELGISQNVGVKGLYQAISAGVPKDNVFEFMKVAGKAAIAGNTDVETSIDGVTTYLNAFGLEAKDAGAVADSMFQAVKDGKTDFQSLAKAAFNVAPAAAAAKVSFQEVNAAISTLTASGTPTSVATTQIRAALVGLQKPSEAMDKIFQDLGYQNAQVALEAEGLGFALGAVKDASKGNNGELQKLLGSSEAVAAANTLAGTSAQKFAGDLDNQRKSAGNVDTAFAEMEKSTARQMARLRVNLENLGISVGNVLLPWLNKAVAAFTRVSNWLNGMNDQTRKVVVGVAVFAAAMGPLLILTGKFVSALATSAKTLKIVAAAKKVAAAATWLFNHALRANPIGIVVTALTLLAAGLYVAYTHSETFRRIVQAAFDAVKSAAQVLATFFSTTIPAAFQAVLDWVTGNWPKIVTLLAGPFAPLVALATDAFGIRSKMLGALGSLGREALRAVQDLVRSLWRGITSTASSVWNFPRLLFDRLIRPMIDKVSEVVSRAADLSRAVPRGISSVIWGLANVFRDRIIVPLQNLLGKAAHVGKDIASAIRDGIKGAMGAVTTAVKNLFKDFAVSILTVIGKIPFVDMGGAIASVRALANGDVINRATLAVVGEDGPEAVIPLGRKRRARGRQLLTQAARIMATPGDPLSSFGASNRDGIPLLAMGGIFSAAGSTAGFLKDKALGSVKGARDLAALAAKGPGALIGLLPSPPSYPGDGGVVSSIGRGVRGAAVDWIKDLFSRSDEWGLGSVVAAFQWAKQQMGKPYVWGGGHSPGTHPGYDCSGFASNAWRVAAPDHAFMGTTFSLFPASRNGSGPFTFGFRGMQSNDPRQQHMGARILDEWFHFGNPGNQNASDSSWTHLRIPPGVPGYYAGGPVSGDGTAYLHRGEEVLNRREARAYRSGRDGHLIHIEHLHARGPEDPEIIAAALSRKLALLPG